MVSAQKILRQTLAIVAAGSLTLASGLAQDSHVVPLSELHASVVVAGQQRQENLSRLERFFTGAPAENALQGARLNGKEIRNAIAMLNDQELARLSARAQKANSDFAAGSLTNQELTYIVIALGTAVLILVIVAAR
jgi:hypothetical protein